MDLPLMLQMEIDLSAAAHKREIAEGFAKLKERLIPPMTRAEAQHASNLWQQQMLMNMAMNDPHPYSNLRSGQNVLLSSNQGTTFNNCYWY